jgi:hypothetical protein
VEMNSFPFKYPVAGMFVAIPVRFVPRSRAASGTLIILMQVNYCSIPLTCTLDLGVRYGISCQ